MWVYQSAQHVGRLYLVLRKHLSRNKARTKVREQRSKKWVIAWYMGYNQMSLMDTFGKELQIFHSDAISGVELEK